MEKGFVENGFIIDLSNTKNTTQLVFELSSIMEHPDVKGKRICLKLGALDLKQSQLLSIKALIESMDAEIAFIDTASEQTQASAISLGLIVSKLGDDIKVASYKAEETEIKEEEVVIKEETNDQDTEIGKTVEVLADSENAEHVKPISEIEGVEDVYTEQTTQELSEIIPSEHFENDFIKAMQEEEKRMAKPYPFRASVGICCFGEEEDLSLLACMQLADKRMYTQKRKNKMMRNGYGWID